MRAVIRPRSARPNTANRRRTNNDATPTPSLVGSTTSPSTMGISSICSNASPAELLDISNRSLEMARRCVAENKPDRAVRYFRHALTARSNLVEYDVEGEEELVIARVHVELADVLTTQKKTTEAELNLLKGTMSYDNVAPHKTHGDPDEITTFFEERTKALSALGFLQYTNAKMLDPSKDADASRQAKKASWRRYIDTMCTYEKLLAVFDDTPRAIAGDTRQRRATILSNLGSVCVCCEKYMQAAERLSQCAELMEGLGQDASAVRKAIATALRRKHTADRHRLATKIQACWRRHLATALVKRTIRARFGAAAVMFAAVGALSLVVMNKTDASDAELQKFLVDQHLSPGCERVVKKHCHSLSELSRFSEDDLVRIGVRAVEAAKVRAGLKSSSGLQLHVRELNTSMSERTVTPVPGMSPAMSPSIAPPYAEEWPDSPGAPGFAPSYSSS